MGAALLGATPGLTGAQAQPASSLIRDIQSSNEKVCGAAWQNAATVGAKAIKPLAELVPHSEFEVARSAKRALWKIVRHSGRPNAEKERRAAQAELVALLDAANAAVVRHEVLWMLSEIGDESTVEDIARLMADVEVREAARCALERMPGAKAIRALEQAFESSPEDFRPALAGSLRVRGVKVAGYANPRIKPARTTAIRPK